MDNSENNTQPNAYRIEAAEKRALATQLNAEASDLEAKANEVAAENVDGSEANPSVPEESNDNKDVATEKSNDKSDKKLFNKK